MEAFVLQEKISGKNFYMYSELETRSYIHFSPSRPINRDGDCTLTMFQNRFTNMFKAAIQNVSNMEIDDSTNELCERLKEETKELREKDIEGPWSRDIQPGERSDQVIDKCICLNLVEKDPYQVLDLRGMDESEIFAACYLVACK